MHRFVGRGEWVGTAVETFFHEFGYAFSRAINVKSCKRSRFGSGVWCGVHPQPCHAPDLCQGRVFALRRDSC